MPQTLTRNSKGCDASCVGAECSHPTCHEGDPDTILVKCEECEACFCLSHVIDSGTYYMCSPCIANGASNEQAMDAILGQPNDFEEYHFGGSL